MIQAPPRITVDEDAPGVVPSDLQKERDCHVAELKIVDILFGIN